MLESFHALTDKTDGAVQDRAWAELEDIKKYFDELDSLFSQGFLDSSPRSKREETMKEV